MSDLLVITAVGLGTLAFRAMFLVRVSPPGQEGRREHRGLRHVGPAVLAAFTLPALLAPRGEISVTETVPALVAAALTVAVWRRTRRFPHALLSGLATWWLVLGAFALIPVGR